MRLLLETSGNLLTGQTRAAAAQARSEKSNRSIDPLALCARIPWRIEAPMGKIDAVHHHRFRFPYAPVSACAATFRTFRQ